MVAPWRERSRPGAADLPDRAAPRRLRAFAYHRVGLALLPPCEARSFIADVRGRVLDGLDGVDDPTPQQLFAHVMVEQHEHQHVETMRATHQLRDGAPLLGRGGPLPRGRVVPAGSVLVPAGPFTLGVDLHDEPWSQACARDPVAHRRRRWPWGDASFASVAPVLSSGAVLAAVRSATPGGLTYPTTTCSR